MQTPPEIKDSNALEVKREQHVGFYKVRGYGVLTAAIEDGVGWGGVRGLGTAIKPQWESWML